VNRFRIVALFVPVAVVACLFGLHGARMQSSTLRRITNTSEEGINLNPSISGDGRIIAFESTEDVAAAGGTDHFRGIRANITGDPATFLQIAGSRLVAPAISQDGTRIAFASREDLLGTNSDGNSEIFLFDGASLTQVTNTPPGSLANRITNGNFQPSISDDGRFIAFSSNRDLAGQNSDGNLEIFVYDSNASSFAQLTNSAGAVGATDAKISGDGNTIAFIRDNGVTPSTARDLLKQARSSGPATTLVSSVPSLAMTYGRAISDDGARVVYAAETATNTTQVFMFDGRSSGTIRQITALGARASEVPLDPTISGDGSRIAFAARRTVSGAGSNSDGGVELYVYDLPTSTFAKITNAPSSATAEVVSSLNDDGSIVAFNFPRVLSGVVTNGGTENNSEIYAIAPPARPANGNLTAILNDASLGHEPSTNKAFAPDSIAAAQGANLASATTQSQRLADGTFPTNVGGTRVTVNGRAAQIFFVSPAQINFLVPPQTEIGTAEVVVNSPENFPSRSSIQTLRAAPGIFTRTGDGIGEGLILNSDTLQEGPFDPTNGNLRLTIFTTGARNASATTVSIGDRIVNAEGVLPSSAMPGLDEVHVRVPADLRGAGTVNLSVNSDGRGSNPVTVNFLGDPSRAIFFNEILSDPPNGIAGDANNDGVRDGTDDEFVEFVNGSAAEAIGMSGWTVKTRANGSTAETTRFTFPAGTSLPPGAAAVIFGGGNFNPADPIFGCAQLFKATSSAGLSLTNTGLTVLLRDTAGNLIAQFAYGGSTGLDGNNSQSITRSPDITGGFVLHATANPSRRFSPGLKIDGTPFGACAGRPATTTISPASVSVNQGQSTQFTAQTLDQFGRAMMNVPITFSSDNTAAATIDSTSTNQSNGVVTANVGTHNPGVAHITASATDGTTTANSSPATLTVVGPALSVNDVSKNEGNAGASTFTFTVSLSLPAPSGGVKFDIATQDGTATVANNDYVARALANQIIPAGAQTYSFEVTVNGDTAIEANEKFFVAVSNVSGASITKSQGTGTIFNDDSPALSVSDVSANEGNGGTTTFTFTVNTPVAAGPGPITFDIATADGTATSASGDYVARALTGQTIPAGQSSYTFDVTVNGDTLAESNETFFVNITNVSGAAVNDSQGQGTIQNDDTANLVISQVYPGGGLSSATFTNDFIELYNRGTSTIDLSVTPYSAQFLSTTGSTWVRTDLTSGIIAPGRYFLIREASGGSTGVPLPTADAAGTINLTSTTDGKVALVTGTTLLAGSCPGDDGTQPFNPIAVADFVGYGGTATTANHCYEGTGPASFTLGNNTIAAHRKTGGCVDTTDNANDIFTAQPNPRNAASPIGDCKPELTINDVTVTEGNTGTVNATFTVSLSATSAQTVKVDFATVDGTASAPADYQANSGTLTFNPGDLAKSITVLVNGDTIDEPSETFFVNLTNAVNGVILDSQGHGSINDNDAAPSLSLNDVAVAEGDSGTTNATFAVTLSAPSGFTVTVNYATADNTANAGSDYQTAGGTVTFNPGETSKPITVLVNGDTDFEQSESFFVNLSSPANATIADVQGVGTINNDDPLPPTPNFFINDVNITEGDGGTRTAEFIVTLNPAASQTVTVQYATANGAATAGSDYQSANGTITFNANETTKTVSVTINGDMLVEPDETFFVNLSNPSAGTNLGDPQGLGTIQNDDLANLVISQIYPGGGLTGATYSNDFIELYNRATTTVDFSVTPHSVQFLSTGGSTWSKTDLTTGTIAPGHYFLIREASGGAVGAPLPAPDATGTINLTSTTAGKVALISNTTLLAGNCPGDDGTQPFSPAGAGVADFVGYLGTSATANHCYEGAGPASFISGSNTTADFRKAGGCLDNNDNANDFFVAQPSPRNTVSPVGDCKPEIVINDVTITEGNSGTVNATFTVTLTAPGAQTVTVDFATADGTANAPADYQSNNGTLTFNPGDTTKSITVLVNGDTLDEANENFFVNLSNPANASIVDAQGLGTINDNDPQPSLSINDVTVAEGNGGTTAMSFTVTLSAASGQTVKVNYATADNTATEPADYLSATGTLTFNPGETTKSITVSVNGDTDFEQNETLFLNLSGATNASITDSQGVGTINNDDEAPPMPAFFINDVTVSEGDSGTTTANFTVTLSPASSQQTTVDYATANGTAGSSSDYQTTSNTLTFGIGETSKQLSVVVNGDTLVEPDESFLVNLTNPTGGAGIGDNQGLGTIQNDDTANIVVSQVYPGGGLSGATYTNDYIELFNRGTTTVDFSVTPFSAQFLSTTASTWARTDLATGIIAPGHYFLIKETSGGANGAALPAADATGTINLTSTTSGKVALISGTMLLTGNCPGDDGTQPFNPTNMVDFVGYGGTAATANQCYEGSGPSSFTLGNNAIADYRKAGGCTETNDNAADFFTTTPLPHNSTSTNNCAGGATPGLSINDVTVTEGNSGTATATFTVRLSAPAQGTDVTFDIATADGTAMTANGDYVAKSSTNQIIPAGQTTYTFSVNVNGDNNVENDETFFVNVSNVTGAAVADGQGQGTIHNDDLPALSINDVTAAEGDAGTKTFSFTVSLSAPAPATVSFDIVTADGTATTSDNDYVARNLTSQTIAAGQQTFQFDVTVNGDTAIEANETFVVNVTNVAGATVADGQGAGTIQNDDSPALSINEVSANEGDTGTSTFTFTVSLSQPAPAGGVTFDIATADGTATTAANDYVARALTNQIIPAGQSSYTFDVNVNGDKLVESNETFFVNVTNVNAANVLDSQGQGTVQNDDVANLKISQVFGGGNNSGATYQNDFVEIFNHGSTTVDFSVTPYSVQYAGVGSSFGSSKTNLTTGSIAPGKYFLVQESGGTTNGVPLPAPDATGSINLAGTTGKVALVIGTSFLSSAGCPGDDASAPFNPVDGAIADFVGYGSLPATSGHCYEGAGPASAPSSTTSDYRKAGGCTDTNDNAADFFTLAPSPRNSSSTANDCSGGATPNLSINDITVIEGNSGTTTATFTVSLSAPDQGADVTFDIATQDNSATTANSDYIARSLTHQIIPAGQTSYTFSVTVNGDINVEPDESFFVNVTNVSGANVTDSQGTGIIQHDDLPAISINDVTAVEGDAGTRTFSFTVSLSAPAPAAVTFDIATQDNTATVGDNDYVVRNLTAQSIAAGQQSYQFDVTVKGDTTVEPSETFFVNLSNVSGASVADGQGTGTIQNDDSPLLSVSDVSTSEGNSGTTTFTFSVSLNQPAPAGGVTFDIATADGSATTAGNDYLARSLTNQSIAAGQTSYSFDVTVNGDTLVEPSESFVVNVTDVSGATVLDGQGAGTIQNDDTADLKISQVYPGGGNAGATYTNDFIEIFNRGSGTVDFSVTPYSIQYASVGSNFGGTTASVKFNLTLGTIAPGRYFLVQGAGGVNGVALPTPDAISTIAMNAASGKVALVLGTTALAVDDCPGDDNASPFNPNASTIIDFVGYGANATTVGHCYEGSGPAPFSTSTAGGLDPDARSTIRTSSCTDTNVNSADFSNPTTAPVARNSATTAVACP
jgi:ribosomal protein L35AE/L33A